MSFGYSPNKPPVVADASLDLRPGTQLGITGRSGGGKSTLAGLIAGLHRPWSGQVALAGASLATMTPEARARCVGWIGKTPALFAGSLRENLTLWDERHDEAAIRAAVAGLDAVVGERAGGLTAAVEARGTNFSAGQRQRIEIARRCCRRPRCWCSTRRWRRSNPSWSCRSASGSGAGAARWSW